MTPKQSFRHFKRLLKRPELATAAEIAGLKGFLRSEGAVELDVEDRLKLLWAGWEASKVIKLHEQALDFYEAHELQVGPEPRSRDAFSSLAIPFGYAMQHANNQVRALEYLQKLASLVDEVSELRLDLREITAHYVGLRDDMIERDLGFLILKIHAASPAGILNSQIPSKVLFDMINGEVVLREGLARDRE